MKHLSLQTKFEVITKENFSAIEKNNAENRNKNYGL